MSQNNTSLSTAQDELWSHREFTPAEELSLRSSQAIMGFLVVYSILTNAIVIRIFTSPKFGKLTTAKLLYANISLSDELFLFTCILQATIYGKGCNGSCRVVLSYATHISGFVSTYSMALIAFKRFQAIAFPLNSRRKNAATSPWKSVAVPLCLIWIVGSILPLVFVRYVQVDQRDGSFFAQICAIISSPIKASHDKPFFSLIFMVAIPLLSGLAFSIAAIYCLLRSNNNNKGGRANESSESQCDLNLTPSQIAILRKRKLKATAMILVVIVTFAICWLPITFYYTLERLKFNEREECDYDFVLYGWLTAILMIEFGANPVIYWFMNPDFRKGFTSSLHSTVGLVKRLICCRNSDY